MYEQKLVGTVAVMREHISDKVLVLKGEFVIGIYPKQEKSKEKRNKYDSKARKLES
jgi:16S rRNA C1402 (ribose-2'-O) methylase RsmI